MRKTILIMVLFAVELLGQTASKAPSTFRIAGVVVDSVTGAALRNVEMTAAPTERQNEAQACVTSDDGRFECGRLSSGKYLLTASKRGYSAQWLEQHGIFAIAIAVGPALDSEHVIFRLAPDASISGTITDSANDPVADAEVWLYEKNTETGRLRIRQRESTNTDERGWYHFGHLGPGAYFIAVTGRPWFAQSSAAAARDDGPGEPPPAPDAAFADVIQEEIRILDLAYPVTFYPGGSEASDAAPLTLHAGEHAIADLQMNLVAAVHLRAPAPESKVSRDITSYARVFDDNLVRANAEVHQAGDGTTELAIAPGEYIVETAEENEAGMYQSIEIGGDTDLAPDRQRNAASIEGSVEFPAGRGSDANLQIGFTHAETQHSFFARLTPTKEFSLQGGPILPGKYLIEVANSPEFVVQSVTGTGAEVSGDTIRVKDGGRVKLVLKLAAPKSEVTGTVFREGKPFAGAMVILVPPDPGNNFALFRRDQSDSDGTFTFRTILPGQYSAIAVENAWEMEWANPAVLAPYLRRGVPVRVEADGKQKIVIEVQRGPE